MEEELLDVEMLMVMVMMMMMRKMIIMIILLYFRWSWMGVEIDLPEIEGVVVLNISSWGGGCKPWQLGANGNGDIPQSR